MPYKESSYGIQGQTAPQWNVPEWVDGQGQRIPPIALSDSDGRWRILFCFQSWCPGCHSAGLPALRKLVEGLAHQPEVEILAVQTVFEGFETNNFAAMLKFQRDAGLQIPFGHDPGAGTSASPSSILTHYQTGGTPWFIVIGPDNRVVYNDFRINAEGAVSLIRQAIAGARNP